MVEKVIYKLAMYMHIFAIDYCFGTLLCWWWCGTSSVSYAG